MEIKGPGDLILFLQNMNARLPINFFPAFGHFIAETDNLIRSMYNGIEKNNDRYILILPEHDITRGIVDATKHHFVGVALSDRLYSYSQTIALTHPELCRDVGFSRLKIAPLGSEKPEPFVWNSQIYFKHKQKISECVNAEHFRNIRNTHNLMSFMPKSSNQEMLRERFSVGGRKIALFQAKNKPGTAVLRPSDPHLYGPALEYLYNSGYNIVIAGREIVDEMAIKVPFFYYSTSDLISFDNDLALFSVADFALTTGSGIYQLAIMFDVPLTVYENWFIGNPPSGRFSVFVPTLMRNRSSGQIQSFEQQKNLVRSLQNDELPFPLDKFEAVYPSPSILIESIEESISLKNKWKLPSIEQKLFQYLMSEPYWNLTEARVSRSFISNNINLLDCH